MDDAQRKRTIQNIKQRRAVVPVNLDTQRFLDRFEDSDLGREALLRLQRVRYNPSQALLAAQKKRRKKQRKGGKRNLRGEVAEIKRKQKISRDRRVFDAAGNVVRLEGEGGQRRYREGEEPRLFTGLADVGGGLAGVGAGLGAIAAALPALAAPAAAAPAAPAAPVFNFDPEIERQRLAIQDRERAEAHELAQARLQQEAEQLQINRDRLQAEGDRENRRLDLEQQRLDEERRRTAEEQRMRAEQAGQALELERERFAAEQEAERQRLQDLRQGGGGAEPAPAGEDPRIAAELAGRLAEIELGAERERAVADAQIRDARAREEALNADVRALSERVSAAQAREEAQAAEIARIREAPGGGVVVPAGLAPSDREFLSSLVREIGTGLEGGLERRFQEQSNDLTEQIAAHLDRTGRADDVDLSTDLRDAVQQLFVEGGGLEPQPAPVETTEIGVGTDPLTDDEGDDPPGEGTFERIGRQEALRRARQGKPIATQTPRGGVGTETGQGEGGGGVPSRDEFERARRDAGGIIAGQPGTGGGEPVETTDTGTDPIDFGDTDDEGEPAPEPEPAPAPEPETDEEEEESRRVPVVEVTEPSDLRPKPGGGSRLARLEREFAKLDAEEVNIQRLMRSQTVEFAEEGVAPKPGQQRNLREVRSELAEVKKLLKQARKEAGQRTETFGRAVTLLPGERSEDLQGVIREAEQSTGGRAKTPRGQAAREILATDIASRNAEERIRAREEDSDEEARLIAIQEESAGLLARVVPQSTISAEEARYNLSLVPRLRDEVGENPVGRPKRSDTGGRYPPTGWILENPDTVKHNNINPGGRVNIVSRKGNLFRVNTGQGGSGITSMTQSALEKLLREGKVNLTQGEARERPPNLYKKFHGAKFAD